MNNFKSSDHNSRNLRNQCFLNPLRSGKHCQNKRVEAPVEQPVVEQETRQQ